MRCAVRGGQSPASENRAVDAVVRLGHRVVGAASRAWRRAPAGLRALPTEPAEGAGGLRFGARPPWGGEAQGRGPTPAPSDGSSVSARSAYGAAFRTESRILLRPVPRGYKAPLTGACRLTAPRPADPRPAAPRPQHRGPNAPSAQRRTGPAAPSRHGSDAGMDPPAETGSRQAAGDRKRPCGPSSPPAARTAPARHRRPAPAPGTCLTRRCPRQPGPLPNSRSRLTAEPLGPARPHGSPPRGRAGQWRQ